MSHFKYSCEIYIYRPWNPQFSVSLRQTSQALCDIHAVVHQCHILAWLSEASRFLLSWGWWSVRAGWATVPSRPHTDLLEDPQHVFCANSHHQKHWYILTSLLLRTRTQSYTDRFNPLTVASCRRCTVLTSFLHRHVLSTPWAPGTERH